MKTFISSVALVFAVLVAQGNANAASPPNACDVVSKSDAAKALGTSITTMTSRNAGPSSNCTYRTSKIFRSIVITTFRWDSVPQAQSAFHTMVAQTAAMMKPSISLHGLGDEAQRIGPNIYVRKGTAAYVFNLIDGTIGDAKAAHAEALARKAMK